MDEAKAEPENQTVDIKSLNNEQSFLESSNTVQHFLNRLNIRGFQLGGGAIDFALGNIRRIHSDIDLVYIVDSMPWETFKENPELIPSERKIIKDGAKEPDMHGVKFEDIPNIKKFGVFGFRMVGGPLNTKVDCIEAFESRNNIEIFIHLPRYKGVSSINIPASELIQARIDRVTTFIPS